MKTAALILGILVLAACGRQEIDPAFQGVVAQFEAEAAAHGRAIRVGSSIKFNPPAEERAKVAPAALRAVCVRGIGGNTIYVDAATWATGSEAIQVLQLFHELGHCELGLEHVAGAEIMNPDPESLYPVFQQARAALIDHLFE